MLNSMLKARFQPTKRTFVLIGPRKLNLMIVMLEFGNMFEGQIAMACFDE
jgi:hypothetical protein